MERAVELAGFFAAHAVWIVCEGDTLVPLLAFQKRDGTQEFRVLEGGLLEEAVARGQEWLAKNPEDVAFAVLIYEGFLTLGSGRTDALVVEVRRFDAVDDNLRMAIPYRHATAAGRFAVHRPKFLEAGRPNPDFGALGEAFFLGVGQHEKGSAIWNSHLDESK
jgi:hypothetical protein